MGNIVMPKQSADKAEMEAVLSVYKEHNDWLQNSVLINDLKAIIGDNLENQAYTKKVQIPAYFGLIEWEDPSSKTSRKKITERGLKFYGALISQNQDDINEEIIKFLEELSFGRNVHGCSSDSDIEPPKVFIKTLLFIDYLIRKEYGYILWQMDEMDKNLIDLMSEIKTNRLDDNYSYNNTPNKYNDAKPITALYNWGLLESDGNVSGQEKIKLNKDLSIKDLKRLLNIDTKNNLNNIITVEEIDNSEEEILQKIYYGAPGTGKSHKVKELTKIPEEKNRVERVTFHPEYDYNSFVGGYKPTMDGENIRYEFVPQAFTNIYVKAWNNLENDHYLVIEEINRGNCAEIFGDIFQLLDRTNDYKITPSKELKEYLKTKFSENENIDAEKLLLPTNLNILATMNTSDQSLFPMDSAFKRRWDWEYLPICYNAFDDFSKTNASFYFEIDIEDGEKYSWIKFIEKINLNHIKNNTSLGMDKCIGNYFIKPDTGKTISLNPFVNKVIFYLWSDVFKDEENNVFEENTSYEDFFPINRSGKNKIKELFNRIELEPIKNFEIVEDDYPLRQVAEGKEESES
jgi:hypothetical protein